KGGGRARVDEVPPCVVAREAVGVKPGVERLQVQSFERRVLRAEDKRVVLAAGRLTPGWDDAARAPSHGTDVQYASVGSAELILDDDPCEIGPDVRRERRDGRDTGKVARREGGELIRG